MTRIDGLNSLSTSRTTAGLAAAGLEGSGVEQLAGASDAPGGRQDVLSLSDRGRIVAVAAAAVAQSPDVRSARVAVLRAAIADGTYKSNAREIAARLMTNGLVGPD